MKSIITADMPISLPKNTPELPNKRYSIIYADPPWDYDGRYHHCKERKTSSAKDHYPTMKLQQLKMIDIPCICADDCLLFMWTSSPHLQMAIELGNAWGFDYKTIVFVWDKILSNPGFYTQSQVEVCLVFKKGRIPQPRGARNVRQFLAEKRTAHSKKPDIIRDRIVEMFPTQDKIELFARNTNQSWDSWGNEL